MRLIIISGRSGSGKSTALHVLEDIGFTCIDNLPASLLPVLVERLSPLENRNYAISIDARNTAADIERLPALMESPAIKQLDSTIIFLDADDDILLQRFSETRRRHPLSDPDTDLREAISRERLLLNPIIDAAHITIDTTDMGFHDLRDLVKRNIMALENPGITLLFQSFGYKYGLPRDADLVFDVRCLPNPHWRHELRPMTGLDQPVINFLSEQDSVEQMYTSIRNFLNHWLPCFESNNRSYMTVAIGCTGGQHRSVYLSHRLETHFSKLMNHVQCRHRELHH